MKRYVVKEGDGTLCIVTAPLPPPNALCEARDEWLSYEISEANGIVFIDPDKVRKIREAHERQSAHEKRQKLIDKVKRKMDWILVAISFAVGFWLGRI